MKRLAPVAAAALAALAIVPTAWAQQEVPYPALKIGDAFVSVQTVNTNGAVTNFFAPGSRVVFRAYAVDGTTNNLVLPATKRFFYITIPDQPNVRLSYTPTASTATARYAWTGTWDVPATYAKGIVAYRAYVRVKKTQRRGLFVQTPIATASLTITTTPQNPLGNGPTTSPPISAAKQSLALYVDAVNGTRPVGAPPRPVGCTQSNVFKRGEQFVLRAWGFDLRTGEILAMSNIASAFSSVTGAADLPLNWGAHGPAGARVWFWTNAWIIPQTYPLGDVVVYLTFRTTGGQTQRFEYPITIIP